MVGAAVAIHTWPNEPTRPALCRGALRDWQTLVRPIWAAMPAKRTPKSVWYSIPGTASLCSRANHSMVRQLARRSRRCEDGEGLSPLPLRLNARLPRRAVLPLLGGNDVSLEEQTIRLARDAVPASVRVFGGLGHEALPVTTAVVGCLVRGHVTLLRRSGFAVLLC